MTPWLMTGVVALYVWFLWRVWRDAARCDACDRKHYLRWEHETTAWLCPACWKREARR